MAARSFRDSFLTLLFGDAAQPEAARPLLGAPMLSNWLPYRSFDATSRMFINTESVGFILELAPMMGADERSGEILTQFLSDAVPSGCEIQLIHWQSPSIGERIADWVMPRVVAKGVYGRAAMHRENPGWRILRGRPRSAQNACARPLRRWAVRRLSGRAR